MAEAKHNTESDPKKDPWWKSGWLLGLLILGLLHVTGMAVHVQAGVQRVLLETGLFHPDVVAADQRMPAATHFRFVGGDGTSKALSDLKGEVRFVNFWATWCAPCLAEMPAINRLHEDYGDRVAFVMVSVDDDLERARAYMAHEGFGMEVSSPDMPIPPTLSSGVIPTTVVIDRAGRMAVHRGGMADYDSRRFRAALDQLLAEPPSRR